MAQNFSNKNKLIAKNYDSHALEYDKMSRKAIPWLFFDKPFLKKKVLPVLNKNIQLLDLGCGSGKAIEVFARNGFPEKNIYGVDISKSLINLAKKTLPKAKFKIGDFTKLNLPKAQFDLALSVRSIEYLNLKELEVFFGEVYNSLKKGGKFFILTGHPLRVNDGPLLNYLNRGPRNVSLPWGMKVNLYHKTLSDFLMSATSAGFSLEFIDEPPLPLTLKKKDSKRYESYLAYGAVNLHLIFRK